MIRYEGGGLKHISSTTQAVVVSSLIGVTPVTGSSNEKIFPNVILALSTWKSGISKLEINY